MDGAEGVSGAVGRTAGVEAVCTELRDGLGTDWSGSAATELFRPG